MKYLVISCLIFFTLNVHAKNENVIALAKTGKLAEAQAELKKMPSGLKRITVTFKLAEYCFDQGELKVTEELIKEFMKVAQSAKYKKKLSKYIKRANAMLEYISRYGDANIKKTLKKAQALLDQQKSTNKELLDNANVFAARAENWKKRGIPEYDQLTKLINKLLNRVEDKGDASVAVKVALLRCRLLAMEGDNRQCLEILQQCLRYYYPRALKNYYRPRPYPAVARRLLREMGNQFETMAVKSNNMERKIKYYTQATGCYVKSATRLPPKSKEFQSIRSQVLHYQEALRLLGYKLNLDAKFRKHQSGSPELVMYREMLSQKRYNAAVKALQNLIAAKGKDNKVVSAELKLIYASALCGCENYQKSIEICNEVAGDSSLPEDAADTVMNMAYSTREKGQDRQALKFFIILNQIAPTHPDRKMFLQDCAALAVKLNRYEIATEAFLSASKLIVKPNAKAMALFNAAQSQCKEHKYANAVTTGKEALAIENISFTLNHKIAFLIGQSAMMAAKQQTSDIEKSRFLAIAQKQFDALYKDSKIDEKLKQQALLLGGIAAYNDRNPDKAIQFFEQYLKEFVKNDEGTTMQVAGYLSVLYIARKHYRELSGLFDSLLKYYPDSHKTTELLLLNGHRFVKANNPDQALATYRRLIGAADTKPSRLLKVCAELKSKKFDNKRRECNALIYDLIKKQLPDNPTNNVKGELFFYITKASLELGKYIEANGYIIRILNQKTVYNFYESKLLHAEIMKKLNRQQDALKDYQEILLSGPSAEISTRTNALLAQSLYNTGNYKKALAISWNLVPLSGKLPDDKQQREIILKNLKLLKTCARKLNSTEDIKQADKIYAELTRK